MTPRALPSTAVLIVTLAAPLGVGCAGARASPEAHLGAGVVGASQDGPAAAGLVSASALGALGERERLRLGPTARLKAGNQAVDLGLGVELTWLISSPTLPLIASVGADALNGRCLWPGGSEAEGGSCAVGASGAHGGLALPIWQRKARWLTMGLTLDRDVHFGLANTTHLGLALRWIPALEDDSS